MLLPSVLSYLVELDSTKIATVDSETIMKLIYEKKCEHLTHQIAMGIFYFMANKVLTSPPAFLHYPVYTLAYYWGGVFCFLLTIYWILQLLEGQAFDYNINWKYDIIKIKGSRRGGGKYSYILKSVYMKFLHLKEIKYFKKQVWSSQHRLAYIAKDVFLVSPAQAGQCGNLGAFGYLDTCHFISSGMCKVSTCAQEYPAFLLF